MDMYIFAGLVTSMCIFGLNTLTICRDYPDGCDKQREMEYVGFPPSAISQYWTVPLSSIVARVATYCLMTHILYVLYLGADSLA
jgi:hypothetical protein